MICWTRGSFGTVLFDLAYYIGKNNISEYSTIYNIHSISGSTSHAKKTKASLVVSNYRIRTFDVPGRRKQACFKQPDFGSCMQNFFKLTEGGFSHNFNTSETNYIGHMRFPDHELGGLSRDSLDFARNKKMVLKYMYERGAKIVVSNLDTIESKKQTRVLDDFTTLLSAKIIICGFSMFPLSTLLFKGNSKVKLLTGNKVSHSVRQDIRAIQSASNLNERLKLEEITFLDHDEKIYES